MTRWRAAEIAPDLTLEVDREWVWLNAGSEGLVEIDVQRQGATDDPVAAMLPGVVRLLLELGIGETVGSAVRISHSAFANLEDPDLEVLFSRIPHAPFLLELV